MSTRSPHIDRHAGLGAARFKAAPRVLAVAGLAFWLTWACGCVETPPPPSGDTNSTDPTNGGAEYVGAAACQACHASFGDTHFRHGHSQILKPTQGAAPEYPPGLPRTGVPPPPPGYDWSDIDYVIGGYLKTASFVTRSGFVVAEQTTGDALQYHLRLPESGRTAGFEAFNGLTEIPYGFECFRCHTTGAASLAVNGSQRQGGRPGIGGTWVEDGVQCEACHGPGSNHVPNPGAGSIYVNSSTIGCADCHSAGAGTLLASDGFILGYQQVEEVQASPHDFTCTVCHDPHASVFNRTDQGIRNACMTCHTDVGMALHAGRVYVQGDYVEVLACESCHMPLASKYAVSAPPDFTAGLGRVGDTHTHIMNIDVLPRTAAAMFAPGGGRVVTDAAGRAAVTLDYVCLRCHHGQGNAFRLDLDGASTIADGIHQAR
ncbi:MAG: hypothetical protein AMXMBFR13_07440 [Phycisphaerae bacterium]